MDECQTIVSSEASAASALPNLNLRQQAMAVERLPFTIKRVESDEDLWKAVRIRHAAYARHVPAFAQTLTDPEASDYEDDSIVLLAESKLDGSPLGSTRIRTNLHQPLLVEEAIRLPSWLQGRRLAEVTRLGVEEGRVGQLVKSALLKACVKYCEQLGIEWALAAGRSPIDRHYERLMFVDVFADKAPVPLSYAGNIPHRVMAFELSSYQARWTEARHPLLNFFCHTRHPDIDIGQTAGVRPARTAAAHRAPDQARVHFDEMAMA